jgi:hypothetical protein
MLARWFVDGEWRYGRHDLPELWLSAAVPAHDLAALEAEFRRYEGMANAENHSVRRIREYAQCLQALMQ